MKLRTDVTSSWGALICALTLAAALAPAPVRAAESGAPAEQQPAAAAAEPPAAAEQSGTAQEPVTAEQPVSAALPTAEQPAKVEQPAPAEKPAPAAAAPYSVPWQLRGAGAATALRLDSSVAFYRDAAGGGSGLTSATTLLGSRKVTSAFAPMIRLGLVTDQAPVASGTASKTTAAFLNPAVGGTYLFKLTPDLRLAAFAGVTLPLGSGGGSWPEGKAPSEYQAQAAGVWARSAMDSAMFAVNYLGVIPGLSLAFVRWGFTAQLEATVIVLARVRGDPAQEKDDSRVNLTGGLHLGYFIIPQLSIGAELRMQRWLSTPAAVAKDPSKLQTVTFAAGPRGHFQLGQSVTIRPGLSYSRAFDAPMTRGDYQILQVDVPMTF